jgi:potassium-transporting ATPase potassium-binding subunit
MTLIGWLQIALFAVIIALLTRPLGGYLARVYAGERTLLQPLLRPLETALYGLAGVKPETEQTSYQYTVSLLLFHALGFIVLYAILRLSLCCRSIRKACRLSLLIWR